MGTYLFVPGGKRTKSDWDALRAILASRGQRTEAITLSDPERVSLGDHIAEVSRLIDQGDLREVILVGHSYAGFVITGVADAVPGRIARLVYVDSAIPVSGQSLFDVFGAAGIDPGKYDVPAWPPFLAPLIFDAAVIRKISKTYIHCLQSQFLEMTQDIPRRFKKAPSGDLWEYLPTGDVNWRYESLYADHYCMLNAPAALAEILHPR